MTAVDHAVSWDRPPRGLDEIAAELRALRSAAGSPSFTEIAHRIADSRAARGVPAHERRVPRGTIYYCFQDGRRRIDVDIAVEIALALGVSETRRDLWAARVRAARTLQDGADVAGALTELPHSTDVFVGREEELHRIAEVLPSRPSWLTGMPGAGKTQTALRAASRAEASGAVFLDLRGHRAGAAPVSPAAAQRAILHALDADTRIDDDAQRVQRRLRDALLESGRLLVLDDALSPGQVQGILGTEPPSGVIVTSRVVAEGSAWEQLSLQGLSSAEVARLLTLTLPRQDREAPIDPDDAARLTRLYDGLPLAVVLAASRLAARPGWTLGEHLDLLESRIAHGRIDDSIGAEIALSYDALPDDAAQLLRAFAAVPLEAADDAESAALLGTAPEKARPLLALLSARHLVLGRGPGRFSLHSLVRAFAHDRAEDIDSPRSRDEAFARLALHHAERIWSAYDVVARSTGDAPRPTLFPYPASFDDPDGANDWLRNHLPSALALAHAAPGRGQSALLLRISEGLGWWMNLTGHQADALHLHEAAYETATQIGDDDGLAMAALDAGQLHAQRSSPERAMELFSHATTLLEGSDALSDRGVIGVLWNMQALLHLRRGELEEATALLQRAAALHEEREENARHLAALVNLGVVLRNRGLFTEQLGVLDRAIALAERTGNRLHLAYLFVNRAELHLEQEPVMGEQSLRRILADTDRTRTLATDLDSPYLQVSADAASAEAYRRHGSLTVAREFSDRATQRARELGLELTVAEALLTSARLRVDEHDPRRSAHELEEAESLLSPGTDESLRAEILVLRGRLAGDPARRTELWERAAAQFERIGALHRAGTVRDEIRLGGAAAPPAE